MSAADWLDKNEWPDLAVDSDAFSHYTQMSKIMEQYAKEYHAKKLEEARKVELTKYTKFL
tara:strand:- start:1330 stop:1509 length:180 start_codon:yes stop_codon:yes gene_type:complete